MRRLALLAVAIFGFVPLAEALTVRDVIELTRAGLGEEVLLALIEVDRGVYGIDSQAVKSMKEAGVPERVIIALIRSGREGPLPEPVPPAQPVEEQPAPEPQVVVIDHHEEPRVQEVLVPVAVYVPVNTGVRHHHRAVGSRTQVESTFLPFQSGPPAVRPQVHHPEPVYWGFGGKLRPDAWQPHGHKPHRHTPDGHEPRGKK